MFAQRSVLRHTIAGACCLALAACVALGAPLDNTIARLIERTDLGGATVAVHAVEVASGRELVSYRAERDMIPASNMKLITSGMALAVLGSDYVFRTEIRVDESVDPPRLVVIGAGDPALGDSVLLEREEVGMTLDTLFDRVAKAVAAAGVERFSEIVIDDRVFDREFVHPAWPNDQLNRWYCAEVGGLNFARNVVTVYASPTSQGGSPITQVLPDTPWISLANRAQTDLRGSNTGWVSRPEPNDELTLFGRIRTRSEIEVAIHNPPTFAGRLFASELGKRGIPIDERRVRLAGPEESFEKARTVAAITTPIADVLGRINTDSHNLYAECVFKLAGHTVSGEPGSWSTGAAVTRMLLSDALGPDAARSTVISDGSGMSRDNRVRAMTLTGWMRWIATDPARWAIFLDSLATPGEGTLKSRFADGELSCQLTGKSGYLTGVYSLSGVLTEPTSGRQVAFSILINDVPSGRQARNAKPLHEAIVEELDGWLAPRTSSPDLGG